MISIIKSHKKFLLNYAHFNYKITRPIIIIKRSYKFCFESYATKDIFKPVQTGIRLFSFLA